MKPLDQAMVKRLQAVARFGWEKGLTAGSGGNLSIRTEEGIWITRSGSSFRDLQPEDMFLVDQYGQVLYGQGDAKPSIETGFHLAIYHVRPKVMAVYHCHPPHALAYALAGLSIPLDSASDRLLLGELAYVPQAEPGSPVLAAAVETALLNSSCQRGMLLTGHGVIGLGESPEAAYEAAELMEQAAQVGILRGLLQEQKKKIGG